MSGQGQVSPEVQHLIVAAKKLSFAFVMVCAATGETTDHHLSLANEVDDAIREVVAKAGVWWEP